MKKKCDDCRNLIIAGSEEEYCSSVNVFYEESKADWQCVPIADAREICDREGDGRFVYFEPNVPAGGAAFQIEALAEIGDPQFVQITRPPAAMAATAGCGPRRRSTSVI